MDRARLVEAMESETLVTYVEESVPPRALRGPSDELMRFVPNAKRDPRLLDLCRYWQKVLRLQDWDVDVVIKRDYELENEGAMAEIHIYPEKKAAVIKVLDEEDLLHQYRTGRTDRFPYESQTTSVVHELLHLHARPLMDAVGRDSVEYIAGEAMIDAVARALVNLAYPAEELVSKREVFEEAVI